MVSFTSSCRQCVIDVSCGLSVGAATWAVADVGRRGRRVGVVGILVDSRSSFDVESSQRGFHHFVLLVDRRRFVGRWGWVVSLRC